MRILKKTGTELFVRRVVKVESDGEVETYQGLVKIVTLKCGHVFSAVCSPVGGFAYCSQCLDMWLKKHKEKT